MELINILEKLNIDKSYLIYFQNGKLENLTFNKDKRIYTINLSLDEPLPATVYVATLDALTKYLSSKDSRVQVALYIKLNKINTNCKIVKDYITFYIDSKVKNASDYKFLKEQSMNIRNNEVLITYESALLEECLNDLKGKLERFISAAGFSYLRIKIIYVEPEEVIFDYEKDKEDYEQLLQKFKAFKAIEEENKKKAEFENNKPSFKRPSFKGKEFVRVELDSIPKDIVDIETEVKIFDVMMEGKNGKRFKINFTNYKTSYTGRIWTNKTNTPEVINQLKNKWVIIRGTLSYNQFDKEESLEIFNFDILDKEDEIRLDDNEVKRVELHAHTCPSSVLL